MTIRPVEFNGLMQRSQDVSTMKQHEDNRPVIEQQTIQFTYEKKTQEASRQVTHAMKKESDDEAGSFDAREEGKNKYFGDSKKKKQQNQIDKVTVKNRASGFDVKI